MRTITSIVEGFRPVCSRSGREMFSPTVNEPISAPPWNANPILRRTESISCSEAVASSIPLTRTSPECGFSNPTIVRNSVLFPDPDPPKITTVSPRWISRSTPCSTSRSPNLTRSPFTEIAGASLILPSCRSLRRIKQRGENQIHHHHYKNGNHHSSRCRLPDLFRSRPRGKPLLATDRRNHQPEHDAFRQARHDIS